MLVIYDGYFVNIRSEARGGGEGIFFQKKKQLIRASNTFRHITKTAISISLYELSHCPSCFPAKSEVNDSSK